MWSGQFNINRDEVLGEVYDRMREKGDTMIDWDHKTVDSESPAVCSCYDAEG